MMIFLRQIALMLWKNWILQRRRICVSIFEIVLPLLLAVLLLLLRYIVEVKPVDEPTVYPIRKVGHFNAYSYMGYGYDSNHSSIIGYSPAVRGVKDLLFQVQNGTWDQNIKPTFKGFEDEDAMEDFAKKHPDDIFMCISFLNIQQGNNKASSSADLPRNLQFVIRPQSGHYWGTDATYEPRQGNKPRGFTYILYDEILLMQRLMGESLIKYWLHKTGGDPNQAQFEAYQQRMAYPPFVRDPLIEVVQTTLPNILIFSLIISVIINTKNLVYEKENKLKESMKLMGLLASAHWVSWFITFCIYLVPVLLLFAIFLGVHIVGDHGPILHSSDTSLVFAFLLCYGLATITFSFMIASIVQKANMASALSGIVFYVSIIPYNNYISESYSDLTRGHKLSFSLLFNCAMAMGANIIGFYEGTGEGVKWSNIATPATVDDNLSLADCMLMLIVDSFIHLLVFWYLDNVRPGEFGVPKPYHFCLTKSYWFGEEQKAPSFLRQQSDGGEKMLRFEADPENLTAGIEINGLTKDFGKTTAVKGLTMKLYEGQITVLLGHNGAGKTTTMSMLTGFIPPTSGSATVNGYSITKDMQGVRSSLGLCPQHNILFDKLTVKEHLQFFARLKGATNKQAEEEIGPLLAEVGISEKTNELTERLSGGQKRKLSVAIALIAGSKIVILDEPSSGMDPGARRQTWDVLQKHREGRTVLLTTHYMDEADVLGDRIAIMAEGVVKCCGTSMFLKKLYGAGYHLVVVKEPSCKVDKLTNVITSHVDTAKLETVVNQEVTYLLPEKETSKFPALFTELDEKKADLGIGSFGTSATTMEEVFLKVGESAHHHDDYDEEEGGGGGNNHTGGVMTSDPIGASEKTPLTEEAPGLGAASDGAQVLFSKQGGVGGQDVEMVDMGEPDVMKFAKGYQKNTGLALEVGKMRGIFVKKALHTWRHRSITLVQLILPVIFTCFALGIDKVQHKGAIVYPPLTFDLAHFESTVIPTTAGMSPSNESKRLEEIYGRQFDSHQEVRSFEMEKESHTYDNYTLDMVEAMGIGTFNKRVIVGLEMEPVAEGSNNLKAISHFNGQPLHAEPIGINYLMNALLQYYLNESFSLQSGLHPLPKDEKSNVNYNKIVHGFAGMNVAFLISFGMAFLTALFVYYYIKERQVGSKHLQVVSGISPLTYWLPTFLWDLITYTVPCIFLLIVFAVYNMEAFAGGVRPLVLLFHLIMYGLAVLPTMYALQFLFSKPPTGVNVIITFNILTGLVCLLVITILKIPSLELEDTAEVLDVIFMLVFPNYCMSKGLMDVYINYQTHKQCEDMPCGAGAGGGVNPKAAAFAAFNPCCKDTCGEHCYQFVDYLAMEKPGIGVNILIFFCTGVFYFLLVFLIEYHILQKLVYWIVKKLSKPAPQQAEDTMFQDSDVANENERINGSTPAELSKTDSLLFVNLYKKYGRTVAVDHTCLGIPKEECFGLLGQNGAGKTTTFKMLTGDVMVTGGNAYLAGHDICNNIKKVQSNMGYCPQFDALIDQMTGKETLTMYARLRGVPETHIHDVVNNLIDAMTLTPHADKLASAFSGGNKRKLSTAIALVGMPDFIMLDEPSAGMDPKARRHLWTILSQVRAAGHTLILTSHSMEECDALCTRLAIMVNGRFVCLGSPQHLKSKFGEGYTLVVQMGLEEDGTRPPIQPLVDYMAQYLPGLKVFDNLQGYVHFQVPDSTVKLANVFGLMEATKEHFNIRNYSVHQTTLEQVFLTFTRAQNVVAADNARKAGCLGGLGCCR